jgi:hypothetical protein
MTKHANGLGILSQQDVDFEWKLKITTQSMGYRFEYKAVFFF